MASKLCAGKQSFLTFSHPQAPNGAVIKHSYQPPYLQVFEKGNFAGLEEMKKNDRLFNRVAPMGINDILMAVQYKYEERPPLAVPMISFEGLLDGTIDPNNMGQWEQYTSKILQKCAYHGRSLLRVDPLPGGKSFFRFHRP